MFPPPFKTTKFPLIPPQTYKASSILPCIILSYFPLQQQSVMESGQVHGNFNKMSKIIQSNRIQVSLIEDTMRKQVERNRQTYHFPAAISKAKLHRHAAKFGFRKDLKGEIPVVCPCCKMRMDNQPIPICYGTSESTLEVEHNYEEFQLPPGVAVFFSILKATMGYLFILAAFTVYDLIAVDLCQIQDIYPAFSTQKCTNSAATHNASNLTIDILFLSSLLASIIFFIIYRKSKNQWHRFIYSKNQTEEAYTILISNIPVLDFPKAGEGKSKSQFFYRKHLEDYLEDKIKSWAQTSDSWQRDVDSNENDYLQTLKRNQGSLKSQQIVKSISLCYNLNRLQIIDDTRTSLIQNYTYSEQEDTRLVEEVHDNKQEDRFSTLPKKIQFINDCRIVLNNQYASDNSFLFNLTHFVGHAFVSFQYQHYRNFFLDQYQRNPKGFVYNGNVLKIVPAVEPYDVNWKNLRVGLHQKQRMQLNSYFIILLIILIEFVVLIGMNLILYNAQSFKDILNNIVDFSIETKSKEKPYIFIITASIFIVLINSLLKKTITTLVGSQRHKTRVNQTTTYMNKSVLAQFISSCLSLFFMNLLLGSHDNLHFYANTFIAISSVIQLLYQLIHPSWVWREVRRWWRYRGMAPSDQVNKFQCILNKQFEYPEYQLAKRYSYYLYKASVALFFAYPAPLGIFLTLITLFLMYWIDKINLFTRSSLYYPGNLSISNHALKMLQFSLIIYAGALFYFSSLQEDAMNIPALCGVGLAFLFVMFILVAPARLERWVFGREAASDKFIYDDCVSDGKFGETYWSRNPATMLVEEQSVTGKEMVTNPALMRRYSQPNDYQHLL